MKNDMFDTSQRRPACSWDRTDPVHFTCMCFDTPLTFQKMFLLVLALKYSKLGWVKFYHKMWATA